MWHCKGNNLSSQADIWKTLWWLATNCSTSSENYPISPTHYGPNLTSLLVTEHSVPILLPSATITKELLLSSLKWVMLSGPQTEAVCVWMPFLSACSGEQNLLETRYETTAFDSHTKLWADVLWRLLFLTLCCLFRTRACGRGKWGVHRTDYYPKIFDKASDFIIENPKNLTRLLLVKLQLIMALQLSSRFLSLTLWGRLAGTSFRWFLFVSTPQVWDYELERSAEHWAHTCRWEHGPSHMLTQIGQNLGAHWGRYVGQAKSRTKVSLLYEVISCHL